MDFNKFSQALERAKDAAQTQKIMTEVRSAEATELAVLEGQRQFILLKINQLTQTAKHLADLAELKVHEFRPFPTAADAPPTETY